MAAAIRARFGADPDLVPGATGAFEVYLDKARIFSKLAEGRFPEDHEILDLVSRAS